GRGNAGSMAAAVLTLMETLGVREKLACRADLLKKAGKTGEAKEWEGVFDSVSALFNEMQDLLGSMTIDAADFCLLAKAGLDSLKLGMLPSEPDQLVIGDVERSRYNDVKALLILGMNDGVIPGTGRNGGIITDRERVLLEQIDSDLGYTDERALFEERFYIYRLLTRPTERLYLSYAETGGDGKPLRKSPVLKEIEKLFPDLRRISFAGLCRTDPLHAVAGEASAARALAEQIRLKQEGWDALYALLLLSPGLAARLEKMEEGALRYYRPVPLTEAQAEALFGSVLKGSVTRLERFSACPYRHFLQYGLSLEKREDLSWEAADHGTFFHKVMELVLSSVKESGRTLRSFSEEERNELIGRAVEEAAGTEGEGLQDKAGSAYLIGRWGDLFRQQLKAMAALEQDDGFRPEKFEMHFGGRKNALVLDLGEGRKMSLSGQIDRLDIWRKDGTDWIRIVDYKTSPHKIEYPKLREGLQLQLFTYLDVALGQARAEGKNAMPGGLYYAVLTDKWIDECSDPSAKLMAEYRMNGMTAHEAVEASRDVVIGKAVTTSEMLAGICGYVRRQEVRLGREIYAGKIEKQPTEGNCSYCEFKSVCRFDERVPGMKSRRIDSVNQVEFLQKISETLKEKEVSP
ncbi:MAG: PD-(D/E)XK nuclease family protein, partial [Oscillospiraceae bacterium]|nr:PD-(D/E)XK nuclease family protein [Oscillospiraceae bacterium]